MSVANIYIKWIIYIVIIIYIIVDNIYILSKLSKTYKLAT